jgi:hypothetical protein
MLSLLLAGEVAVVQGVPFNLWKAQTITFFLLSCFFCERNGERKKPADEIDGKEDAWIDGRVFLAV